MKVNLTELTKRYSRLSEEQFSRIDPQDLTKDARAYYDREAERRRTSEWQTEQRERDQKFDKQQLQFEPVKKAFRRFFLRWLFGAWAVLTLLLSLGILSAWPLFSNPYLGFLLRDPLGFFMGLAVVTFTGALFVAVVAASIRAKPTQPSK